VLPIFLRQKLTAALIHNIYGGFEALSADWEDRSREQPQFPHPIQRTSCYRWLQKGVPTKKEGPNLQFFGFCALLDVDPLAIFDYERNGYFSKFAKIRQMIYYGQRAMGGLAPLLEMYRPGDVWPSDEIARICYRHPWFAHEFTNSADWSSSDYLLVKIKFSQPIQLTPRAVHIAYRRVGVPDTMWRYYGTVLAIERKLELYNESGDYQFMEQVEDDEIRFRTYFGGRPVEWRIVSLHEFSVEKVFPYNDMTTIGFNW